MKPDIDGTADPAQGVIPDRCLEAQTFGAVVAEAGHLSAVTGHIQEVGVEAEEEEVSGEEGGHHLEALLTTTNLRIGMTTIVQTGKEAEEVETELRENGLMINMKKVNTMTLTAIISVHVEVTQRSSGIKMKEITTQVLKKLIKS